MLLALGHHYTAGDTNDGAALVHFRMDRHSDICSQFHRQRPSFTAFARARRLHCEIVLHISLSSLALNCKLGAFNCH